MKALVWLGVASALVCSDARGQCLQSSEKTALEQALRTNISNSDWRFADLSIHAADRLGVSHAPNKADAYDPTRANPVNHLASRIADELDDAQRRNSTLDAAIAQLARTPEVNQSNRPYRSVNQTLDTAYTQFHRMWLEYEDLRDRAVIDPSLAADATASRRQFDNNYRDLGLAVKVRRVATLLDANNFDVGERLHEFWLNHFNVSSVKGSWATFDYHRMLKARQCRTFKDLLLHTARHPAMLMYLDNYKSRIGAINENFARELLELHTIGDGPGTYYHQSDVTGVAKALSGWTWRRTEPTPDKYRPRFYFSPSGHDGVALNLFATAPQGIRLGLNQRKDAEGNNTSGAVNRGIALFTYLASHPATRRNVCAKLSNWLLGISPDHIVSGCASDSVWGTDGDLSAIYQYLLTRPEMFHSVAHLSPSQAADIVDIRGNKVKTPLDWTVSMLRATQEPKSRWLQAGRIRDLANGPRGMGLDVGQVEPPTGYKDDRSWASSGTVIRLHEFMFTNAPYGFVSATINGTSIDAWRLEEHYVALAQEAATHPAAERDRRLDAATRLLATEGLGLWHFSESTIRRARIGHTRPDTSQSPLNRPTRTLSHLLLGSPEFLQR